MIFPHKVMPKKSNDLFIDISDIMDNRTRLIGRAIQVLSGVDRKKMAEFGKRAWCRTNGAEEVVDLIGEIFIVEKRSNEQKIVDVKLKNDIFILKKKCEKIGRVQEWLYENQ